MTGSAAALRALLARAPRSRIRVGAAALPTLLARTALVVWLPAAIFAAWWLATARSTSPFWPPLSTVLDSFADSWLFAQVATQLAPSLVRLGEGFGIGAACAIPLGLALGLVPIARAALLPLLDFGRAIPSAALIPAAFFLCGRGDAAKAAVVAWAAFFPVLLNTVDGVGQLDPRLRELARAYGLRRRDTLLRIVLPAAAPRIFAGLRVSLGLSLLVLVVAEMLLASSGLGYLVASAQTRFDVVAMWSAVLMLMLLSLVFTGLLDLVERRVLHWQRHG